MQEITMKLEMRTAAAIAVLSITGAAWGAQPIVYPAKGQSAQQQQKDQGECYGWAKTNTGVDPAAVAAAPPPPSGPAVGGGERASGAARGAVGGVAIGAIAGDAGKGAAIGAVAGTMAGGHRARQNQQAQQASAQNQKQGAIDTFNRAYAACMEGRGYTIK
jgi:outer membrane protein with glycine zipper